MANQFSDGVALALAIAGPVGALVGVGATLVYNRLSEKSRSTKAHLLWLRDKQYEEFTARMVAAGELHLYASEDQDPGPRTDDERKASRTFTTAVERALLVMPAEDSDTLRNLAREFLYEALASPSDTKKLVGLGKQMRDFLRPLLADAE